jgi:hypothetical protein
LSKASEQLEARWKKRAFAEFKRAWWWFDPANQQHIHEFSAAWEILRRTDAYRLLYDRMRAVSGTIDKNSPVGVPQSGAAMISFRNMLPQSPPAPSELREMVERWQNMIANGWTPEKNYFEASKHSRTACVLINGQTIRIPPTYGFNNRGIPVILPRQVASKGHTTLFVELCDIALIPGQVPEVVHRGGSTSPTEMLAHMHELGKPIARRISGRFIAIEFPLHHPTQALKALLKLGLDSIEQSKAWQKPPNRPDEYSRGPHLVVGTLTPLQVIAFFRADQPRNVIGRGFGTLIRPERIKKKLPKIRKEWIEWDSAERAKYAPGSSQEKMVEKARAAWEEEAHLGRLAHQSTSRPIRPKEELDNLACANCKPFYHRNRAQLPAALPERLRKDSDFNKRIEYGRQLISSVDDLFLALLNCSPKPSA